MWRINITGSIVLAFCILCLLLIMILKSEQRENTSFSKQRIVKNNMNYGTILEISLKRNSCWDSRTFGDAL